MEFKREIENGIADEVVRKYKMILWREVKKVMLFRYKKFPQKFSAIFFRKIFPLFLTRKLFLF
jgi:hypothetical protein